MTPLDSARSTPTVRPSHSKPGRARETELFASGLTILQLPTGAKCLYLVEKRKKPFCAECPLQVGCRTVLQTLSSRRRYCRTKAEADTQTDGKIRGSGKMGLLAGWLVGRLAAFVASLISARFRLGLVKDGPKCRAQGQGSKFINP